MCGHADNKISLAVGFAIFGRSTYLPRLDRILVGRQMRVKYAPVGHYLAGVRPGILHVAGNQPAVIRLVNRIEQRVRLLCGVKLDWLLRILGRHHLS